jgi:hypothetical protein
MRPGDELPMNRLMNPIGLLYAIPGKGPMDAIDLLRHCGIQILINDAPPTPKQPYDPCRELAVGILLRAVDDALHTRGKTRAEATAWLLHDREWFPIWCNVVDINPVEARKCIRHKLEAVHVH